MKIGIFNISSKQQPFFEEQLPGHQVTFAEDLTAGGDFEVISIFKSEITEDTVKLFPNLKMIALRSTGYDNVEEGCVKQNNIVVCNVPAYGRHTVAEFTFGLILSLTRRIPWAVNHLKTTQQFVYEGFEGMDLFGKTIGVVGTGKIGANVIKIAKGFEMKVLAYDTYPNQELSKSLGFEYTSLENLLKNSDIVTLHTPSTPETKHLINESNLSLMKKTAYLVNTSRGVVVETEALIKALENQQIKGAGIDVLEDETNLTAEEAKLLDLDSVLATPHMAFYTKEAEQAILQTTVENILNFIKGVTTNAVV